jgi:cupin 2 domain-containing protein
MDTSRTDFQEISPTGNIFQLPTKLLATEIFEPLHQSSNLLIERIISTGQITPIGQWYDQDCDEWVILLQGEAEIADEDGFCCQLKTGDYLFIPAHKKHRVTFTSQFPPCIWLAIHG